MQLGIIGLGRMGANMALRLMQAGHECVVYDVRPQSVAELAKEGAVGADSMKDMVVKLKQPRAIWMMLPAAIVDETIATLAGFMSAEDVLIDGGNSFYQDDIARAKTLGPKGIHYVDVGTSGGVWGLERGYCMMIGGEGAVVRRLDPIFAALAPPIESAPRTRGREKRPSTAEHGYLHCGPAGAGHFVKMVHNGIEYGIMAAYAEGFNILRNANIGARAATRRCRNGAAREPGGLSIRSRRRRNRRSLAAGQRDRVLASRSRRGCAVPRPRSGAVPGPGVGLGRRALDPQGGHRRRRAGACVERCAL